MPSAESGAPSPWRIGTVSVVMPARNAASTLPEAIASVQAQTHADWELWIIDDASTDATQAVALAHAERDHRIRVRRNAVQQGAAASRNQALARADGEFVAFLDADDRWFPDKLARQLAAMSQAGAAACCSAYEVIDAVSGARRGVRRPPARIGLPELAGPNPIGCLTMVCSQARLGRLQMPVGTGQEDYLTWVMLLRRSGQTVLGLPQVLASYRVGAPSLSSNKWQAATRQWRVYRQALDLGRVRALVWFVRYAWHNGWRAVREW